LLAAPDHVSVLSHQFGNDLTTNLVIWIFGLIIAARVGVIHITLTYVVVRIWDLRRLVVPITHFMEQPFQNWTRSSADILGTVSVGHGGGAWTMAIYFGSEQAARWRAFARYLQNIRQYGNLDEAAKRFEFEKAAKLRDTIKELRTKEFLFA